MVFEQLLLNGIIAGGIYALIAIGFNMTYGLLRFINLAHGSMFAIGAYAAYEFFSLGIPIIGAFILAILVAAFLGVVINYTVFKPLRKNKSNSLILLLASVGIFILLENFTILLFGAEAKSIRLGSVTAGTEILGAIITQPQIAIIIVSFGTLFLLELFLTKTKTGKAMRATSDNKDVAQVIGINVERISTYTFALASALAASAGVLIAVEQHLVPTMGFISIIKGFTASVVGGLGSIKGAVVGAFILGFAENIGVWFVPSGYKDAIAFVVLIIFLFFRPQGIFGRRE